jgi:hypothetical protein
MKYFIGIISWALGQTFPKSKLFAKRVKLFQDQNYFTCPVQNVSLGKNFLGIGPNVS